MKIVSRLLWPLGAVAVASLAAACGSGATRESLGDESSALVPTGGGTPIPVPTSVPPISPTSLAPLSLTGFGYYDRITMLTRVTLPVSGHLTWPEIYDIAPPTVHFMWKAQATFASSEIAKLAVENGYVLQVSLNGRVLTNTHAGANLGDFYTWVSPGGEYGCPVGVTCLGVSVKQDALPMAVPWNLQVDFWQQPALRGSAPRSSLGHVLPSPVTKSYFLDKIAPTFQSERCMHCHALGSVDLLMAHHDKFNVGFAPGYVIETAVPPNGTRLRCAAISGCHTVQNSVPGKVFTETEWMVPKFDQGIDWTGKTPAFICLKVRSRLSTPDKMKQHFFDDGRIGWALQSAITPDSVQHAKAPPGNYADFVMLMTPWIDGGQECP